MDWVFDKIRQLKKEYGEDNIEFNDIIHDPYTKSKPSLMEQRSDLISRGYEVVGDIQGDNGTIETVYYKVKRKRGV